MLVIAALVKGILNTFWDSRNHSGNYAAIEFGGTFTRVAIVKKHYNLGLGSCKDMTVVDFDKFDTTEPIETLTKIVNFLATRQYDGIGIAAFGPLCLDKIDKQYGFITTTPKLKFEFFDLVGTLRKMLKAPETMRIGIDTDVNACAMAEYISAHRERKFHSLAYITVGTGIGVGIMVNGKPVHGLVHPEGGHMMVKIHPKDADFKGVCPYHKTCMEGMTTNNAIAARLGCDITHLDKVSDTDEIWDRVAFYLAQICLNLLLTLSIEVIVLGGGVMNRKCLYPKTRKMFAELLNGYVQHPRLKLENLDHYIIEASFGEHEGIFGAATVLDFTH